MSQVVTLALLLGVLALAQITFAAHSQNDLSPSSKFKPSKIRASATKFLQTSEANKTDEVSWYDLLYGQVDSSITLDPATQTLTVLGGGSQAGIGQTLKASGLQSLEFNFNATSGTICFGVVENYNTDVTIDTIFVEPEQVNMICTNNTQGQLYPVISEDTTVGQTMQLVIDYNFLQLHFIDLSGSGYWVGDFILAEYAYIVYVFVDAGTLVVYDIQVSNQTIDEGLPETTTTTTETTTATTVEETTTSITSSEVTEESSETTVEASSETTVAETGETTTADTGETTTTASSNTTTAFVEIYAKPYFSKSRSSKTCKREILKYIPY